MASKTSIAASLPEFTEDPVDRLRHTLAAYPDTQADGWAVRATGGGVVPGHDVTGLTWGDLREILKRLES